MKIKVTGKAHLQGTSKRTGNPYDFILPWLSRSSRPLKMLSGNGFGTTRSGGPLWSVSTTTSLTPPVPVSMTGGTSFSPG